MPTASTPLKARTANDYETAQIACANLLGINAEIDLHRYNYNRFCEPAYVKGAKCVPLTESHAWMASALRRTEGSMHKYFRSSSTSHRRLSAAFMAALTIVAIVAAPISISRAEDEDISTLSGDHQKQQFVAGARVEITNANVADDIFAMGRNVIFDTVSAKNIFAGGMSLSLKTITADDLIAAGGQVDVSGNIKNDVIAAVCPFCPVMGRLHLTSDMQIGDDARLAGRDIAVNGHIGGDLYAAAQQFRLSGEVVGTARIEADRIALAPGARIGGDLLYTSETKPEVADDATIVGQVRQVES